MLPDAKTRKFVKKDLLSVYRLIQNTINASYGGVYPQEAVEFFKDYHNHDNILNDTTAGYTIVVESNGQIIGTGTLVDANIRRVFVDLAHQQCGIGKLITQELERKAFLKKLASLDLQSSLVSREFWESMGYVIQEERFIPVRNNQKLRFYEMTKTLSGRT